MSMIYDSIELCDQDIEFLKKKGSIMAETDIQEIKIKIIYKPKG